jgi:4-hydroxybenzoate polyprenyltransferase
MVGRPVALAHRLAPGFASLRRFVHERFPPWATVPMAALIYAAPASLERPAPLEAARGALATFLGFLCLRIADDLADLEHDRAHHPDRGLCTGAIDPWRLRDASLALGAVLLAIESTSWWRLAFFLGACAFYRAWFSPWRSRVHAVARPFLSNLAFPFAMLHAAGPGTWRPAAILAAYSWLAAVAHEFGHNVASSGPGYARTLGARGTAVLSAALFAAAFLSAALLYLLLGRPRPVGGALIVAAVGLAFFLVRLVRDPGPQRARSLYRAGIVFALAPALGLLLSR